MTMSLMNAIRSIKQDEKWVNKIIVCGLACLVAQIVGSCSMSFIAQKTAFSKAADFSNRSLCGKMEPFIKEICALAHGS